MTDTATVVETEVWEPDTARPGYSKRVRVKTIREVFEEVRAAIATPVEYSPGCGIFWEWGEGCNEYMNVPSWVDDTREWPKGRLVVFAVTGGSEGHYVHVEVQDDDNRSELLFLGKTFDGWDPAWTFAKRLAKVLQV